MSRHEEQFEAVVVGAGAAGLAATRALVENGLRVVCVEARDRIGGRMFSVDDPGAPMPVDLGPEFIHGKPAETWGLVREHHLAVFDCEENSVQIRGGKPLEQQDSWDQIEAVNAAMDEVEASGKDVSFWDFIRDARFSETTKQAAAGFVEGFNAAHKEVVSVAALAREGRAARAINSDYNFRFVNGYRDLIRVMGEGLPVRLQQMVEAVEWSSGEARIVVSGGRSLRCERVILTLPLGVLQARSVRFEPEPKEIFQAADALRFGQVNRVVLRFREAWWEEIEHLADCGFWLSQEQFFPTWWTALPMRTTSLVGWSAGPHADLMAGMDREEVIGLALDDLSRVADRNPEFLRDQLAAAHFHNWRRDPFALGAYSYVPVGALSAREKLAAAVEDTLFFAGEAAETEGHSATVHGAIASGRRAARQIMAAARAKPIVERPVAQSK